MSKVDNLIGSAVEQAYRSLVSAGDWLSGEQRRVAWLEVRDARTNRIDRARRDALSPYAGEDKHPATPCLSESAVEVLHRVASDPGRLTNSWAMQMIANLGEETYTELVGITALATTVDTFSWGRFSSQSQPRKTEAGEPQRQRPPDVGDVGAWVSQSMGPTMANVSRSLSLVPATNLAWTALVQAMYSRGSEFLDVIWNRALSRPQVELLAARTTAELECFY